MFVSLYYATRADSFPNLVDPCGKLLMTPLHSFSPPSAKRKLAKHVATQSKDYIFSLPYNLVLLYDGVLTKGI